MTHAPTVVVAMSGGVDSSVAAALLLESGYRVLGVTMRLWSEADAESPEEMGALGAAPAVERAQRVARHLGIPLHVVDLRDEFRQGVVEYLIDEYGAGRTPNPCLVCNRTLKFGRLLHEARRLGGDLLATGHYVRTAQIAGRWRLLRGLDRSKDQSYVLYMLGQEELAATRFPLGDLTKDQVRQLALQYHLQVARQAESQEICFIADDDYRRFLQTWAPDRLTPGPILSVEGREIGRHRGLPFYTIGQRKGLGIAAAEPLYVLALDRERNAVIAGPRCELGRDMAHVSRVSYVSDQPPAGAFEATVKIRYQARETDALVTPGSVSTAVVRFAHDLRDITPGQGIVFYEGESVIGGGIIDASEKSVASVAQ
jgi:tRNA-uridine 2-sulfurtransferase